MSVEIYHPPVHKTYRALHLFSGIGGGAIGFQGAVAGYRFLSGRFETLCGIDIDPAACEDFRVLTGAPAHVRDLFSREQYEEFHGTPPPEGWREFTAEELCGITGGLSPDVVFTSAPCKGFSALLPAASAESPKYQALNRLALRGIDLVLAAFPDNPPAAILFENVPRIVQRGTLLLSEIKDLLAAAGYILHEGFHDCGVLGGLGQRRKRYLLIARRPDRLQSFIYQPPRRRLRSIGEVVGPMPMPDDPSAGPMHRLPRLQWKTWVRLALIPAGGDWRDLEEFAPTDEEAQRKWEKDGIRTPGERQFFKGRYGIIPWDEPGRTVIGGNSNGASYIADPRLGHEPRKSCFGVYDWDGQTGTVSGNMRPGASCPASIADPRVPQKKSRHLSHYRVLDRQDPAGTVTGATHVANGALCLNDPRIHAYRHRHCFRIVRLDSDEPDAGVNELAALGVARKGGRFNGSPGLFGVNAWEEPSVSITGRARVSSSNCVAAVADPRIGCRPRGSSKGPLGVQPWDSPSSTVFGAMDIHAGPAAVADPRLPQEGERPDPPPVIIALDGTWHRPLTTLELAALQGFPLTMSDARPLTLSGQSDTRWRERIGNAVPPPTARAIAEQILTALLVNEFGDYILNAEPIWVAPSYSQSRESLIHLGNRELPSSQA